MAIGAHTFVPESELDRLREGSIEQRNELVESLAAANSEQIFGHDTLAKTVATFEKSAVVVSAEGEFRRVYFEATHDGDLVLTKHHTIPVKTYADGDSILEYHRDLARTVVDRLFDGDTESFTESVKDLFAVVDGSHRVMDSERAASIIENAEAPRLWKSKIHEATSEDAAEEHKFVGLYENVKDATDNEDYRELVAKDMAILSEKMLVTAERVESCLDRLDSLAGNLPVFAASPTVRGMSLFAQDLHSDILSSHSAVLESLDKIHAVTVLAELHDTLFNGYLNQDRAAGFVTTSVDALVDGK